MFFHRPFSSSFGTGNLQLMFTILYQKVQSILIANTLLLIPFITSWSSSSCLDGVQLLFARTSALNKLANKFIASSISVAEWVSALLIIVWVKPSIQTFRVQDLYYPASFLYEV